MKATFNSLRWIVLFLVSTVAVSTMADAGKVIDNPGYRPESRVAGTFLDELASSQIAVLPTVIRTRTTTRTSTASQRAVVEFLKEQQLGKPEALNRNTDLGEVQGQSQFDMFQNDEKRLGEIVKTEVEADYVLMVEFLMPQGPSGDISVFGIHVYVLDSAGERAFSFLLNSHHQLFVEARLASADSSEAGYQALAKKGTPVAMNALLAQIRQAQEPMDSRQ